MGDYAQSMINDYQKMMARSESRQQEIDKIYQREFDSYVGDIFSMSLLDIIYNMKRSDELLFINSLQPLIKAYVYSQDSEIKAELCGDFIKHVLSMIDKACMSYAEEHYE